MPTLGRTFPGVLLKRAGGRACCPQRAARDCGDPKHSGFGNLPRRAGDSAPYLQKSGLLGGQARPSVAIPLCPSLNRIVPPTRLSSGSPRHETAPCAGASVSDRPGGRRSCTAQCRLSPQSAARLTVHFLAGSRSCRYAPSFSLSVLSDHAVPSCHDGQFQYLKDSLFP
jgi:hypothetical protein